MMEMIKNTTEGIQQALLDKVSGGFRAGEMMYYSAGSRTGKSYYTKALKNRIFDTNLCKEIILPMFAKPLAEPKYKFSRAKWYTAEYDWVHQVEVLEWCKQQFGPHPQNPDAWSRWCNHYSERIHFRDEKDYVWFCMRWGA